MFEFTYLQLLRLTYSMIFQIWLSVLFALLSRHVSKNQTLLHNTEKSQPIILQCFGYFSQNPSIHHAIII